MKKLITILLGSILFVSCDPDVPGERINLPEMKYGLKVLPDSSYIKLGDTLTIFASIPSLLEDGTKITNGKAIINFGSSFFSETPIISSDSEVKTCIEGEEFKYGIINGYLEINPTSNKIVSITAYPNDDKMEFIIKFIPLKIGTYSFGVSSNFFEGSQGKTRTQPYFEMPNHHFDILWKIPGDDYKPGDYGYDNSYLFAVYE